MLTFTTKIKTIGIPFIQQNKNKNRLHRCSKVNKSSRNGRCNICSKFICWWMRPCVVWYCKSMMIQLEFQGVSHLRPVKLSSLVVAKKLIKQSVRQCHCYWHRVGSPCDEEIIRICAPLEKTEIYYAPFFYGMQRVELRDAGLFVWERDAGGWWK